MATKLLRFLRSPPPHRYLRFSPFPPPPPPPPPTHYPSHINPSSLPAAAAAADTGNGNDHNVAAAIRSHHIWTLLRPRLINDGATTTLCSFCSYTSPHPAISQVVGMSGEKRGFSKAVAVPSRMQRPVKVKLYLGSPGMIGEPYKRPPSLPFFQRWFTLEGWKLRKEYIMGQLKTGYTLAKLRQKNRGYSQRAFYRDVGDLYRKINIALAQGDRSSLRQLVTDNLFTVMKNELKHRETSWSRVEWDLVGSFRKIRTLQARLIGFDKSNHDNAFVQITLMLLSNQKFTAYDHQGKLVAGSKDKELLVEDIWVFERPLLITDAKWRLCGRISL